MKVVTLPFNQYQRLIARLLLFGFLLESCSNLTTPVHPQPASEINASSDYRATLPPLHTSTTTAEVASINQAPPNQPQYFTTQRPIELTSNTYPKTIVQEKKSIKHIDKRTKAPITDTRLVKRSSKTIYKDNQNLVAVQKASAAKRTTVRRSNVTPHMATLLKNQICTTREGYQVKFEDNENGELQAIVEEHYPTGFIRKILPVIIEPGFSSSEAAVTNPAWQKQFIQIIKNCVGVDYVGVGRMEGLLGGGKDQKKKGKGKEKESDSETDDDDNESGEDEFQIQDIQPFIEEGTRNAEKAKGKKTILLLGNTGAGKTTLAKYLTENRLVQKNNGMGGFIAELKDEPKDPQKDCSTIGHGYTSSTFLPAIFSTQDSESEKVYCDLPGFDHTGPEEEQVKISIATQLIINSAADISGVIAVIDPLDLVHTRGNGMRTLSLTLSQLLKGDIKPNSILFVFNNKIPSGLGTKENLENIHKQIEALIKVEENKLEKITKQKKAGNKNNKEYKQTRQILSMLKMIRDNKTNTLQVDLFDQFESKSQIEKLLQDLQPISQDNFNFSEYDEVRKKFNKQLDEIVVDLFSKLMAFVHAHESINKNNEKIESCETLINLYQAHIDRLNPEEANQDEPKILELQQHIQVYGQKIAKLERKKAASQNTIADLTREEAELDTDDQVCHWIYNAYGDADIQYNGPPFTTIEITGLYGNIPPTKRGEQVQFKSEFIDKEKGIYKATYKGYVYLQPKEKFDVSIYGKKRDEAANKARIGQINKELEQQQQVLEQYGQEIEDAQRSRSYFQDLVARYTANIQKQRKQVANRNQLLEKERGRIQREKNTALLENSKQEETKKDAAIYLAERNNLITAVYNLISKGIGSETRLTKKYKEYYQYYQSILDQDVSYASPLFKIKFPKSLCCPILQDKFLDPVITPCEHTFSHANLLDWLQRKKDCPTCRTSIMDHKLLPNLSMRDATEQFEAKKIKQYRRELESILHPN